MTDDLIPAGAPPPDLLPITPVVLELQGGVVADWLAWLAGQVAMRQYSESTLTSYRATIRPWLAFLEQTARTDRPTAGTVQQYVQALVASGRQPATINLYLNTVKSLYRWCETMDRYPSIARSVRTLREFRDGPLPCLSHDQIVDLVRGIPEDTLGHLRDRALIALMYATAFRCVSIVRADVEDLDLDRLSIAHQPKGHVAKDTVAALPQSVADILRRYLDRRGRECGLFCRPTAALHRAGSTQQRPADDDQIGPRPSRHIYGTRRTRPAPRRDIGQSRTVLGAQHSPLGLGHHRRCGRTGRRTGPARPRIHRDDPEILCAGDAGASSAGECRAAQRARLTPCRPLRRRTRIGTA